MSKIVYFDLETTGLQEDCEIIQIGAVNSAGETFSIFALPTKQLSESAKIVTRMDYRNGKLYRDFQELQAKDLKEAMSEFLNYLRDCGPELTLIAHGGLKFDAPVLLANAKKVGLLIEFSAAIKMFSDTFWEIKRRRIFRPRSQSFNLQKLADFYNLKSSDEGHGAHDALGDALTVRALAGKLSNPQWSQVGFTPTRYIKNGRIAFPPHHFDRFNSLF